jgi:hypothetical protein
MRVFAIWVELAHDMTIQGPHDADARHHGRAVVIHDQEHRFDRSLPFRALLFRLGQFGCSPCGILATKPNFW